MVYDFREITHQTTFQNIPPLLSNGMKGELHAANLISLDCPLDLPPDFV